MPLPKFLQSALWSYDISKMSPRKSRDLIITQVLNHGNEKQLKWLFKTYTKEEIKEVVKNPWRGMWMKSVLNYWLMIFELKIPKHIYEKALFHLEPIYDYEL